MSDFQTKSPKDSADVLGHVYINQKEFSDDAQSWVSWETVAKCVEDEAALQTGKVRKLKGFTIMNGGLTIIWS